VDSKTLIYSIPGFADPVSSLTHLIGAAVFSLLTYFLVRRAWGYPVHVAVLSLFAFGSVFLLSISGVYHLLPYEWTGRMVMQRLDHAAIFVLIAASFTPPHGILFRGFQAWLPIALMWLLAVTGITLKTIFFTSLPEWAGVMIYLGFGWIGIFSGVILWCRFGFCFIVPLLAGALAYTIGAILHMAHWPVIVPGVIGSHELFHVAVLMGVACHWYFMWQIADWRPTTTQEEPYIPAGCVPELVTARQEA
jgi:channel protein (hemolysin III family)